MKKLTPRQVDVLAQVRTGRSNKEIARELGVSIETVKTHIRLLFARFDVKSRTGLAMVEYDT